jgi:hypothetical protein
MVDHLDSTFRAAPVTRRLGWLSIALGVAELCAPRAVSRVAGLNVSATLVRFYGLRELACGLGILASRDPKPFLRARVAGDVLDLSTAILARQKAQATGTRRAMATAGAIAGISALDCYAVRARTTGIASNARRHVLHDYSQRSGFPREAAAMRGAALADFQMPRDGRTPDAPRRDRLRKS